jgi:hypothetical protein
MHAPACSHTPKPCLRIAPQDGVLVLPDFYDGINLYCVFDGHGDYGGLVLTHPPPPTPTPPTPALSTG